MNQQPRLGDRAEAVLRVVTVADVLRLAGVEPPTSAARLIRCPLDGHSDSTPSFHVLPSDAGWRCFGCSKSGGVLELCQALSLASSRSAAVDMLGDALHIGEAKTPGRRPHLRVAPARREPPREDPEEARERTERLETLLTGTQPLLGTPGEAYAQARGLDLGCADILGVWFHPAWYGKGPALLFMGQDENGKTIGAQGRFIHDTVRPKTQSAGRIAGGIWASPDALSTRFGPVAIAEAPIDAASVTLASGMGAIATFGAGNLPGWLRRNLAGKTVVLAHDADDAGDAAAARAMADLTLSRRFVRLRPPSPYKDVNAWWLGDPASLEKSLTDVL